MAQFSDKELEKEIAAAAKSLARLPPSIELLPLLNVLEKQYLVAAAKSLARLPSSDKLLTLLKHIEALLSQVEESPAQSVKDDVSRLMKAVNFGTMLATLLSKRIRKKCLSVKPLMNRAYLGSSIITTSTYKRN